MNKNILLTLFIIIIIIILLYYIYYYNIINIKFIDKNTCIKFIENDNDNYFKNFSNADLYARKINNIHEYIINSTNCCVDFTQKEKKLITYCCIKADNFLKKYNNILNGNEISNIKWNIALTDNINNNEYEEGFPHTRNNIIFLSRKILNNNTLVNTLIHEKIHIYQRYNQVKIEKIINNMGYIPTKKTHLLKRANPDLNDIIYYNIYYNKYLLCYYNNNKPKSIDDIYCNINNDIKNEHPYEIMAYTIAGEYDKLNIKKYINI